MLTKLHQLYTSHNIPITYIKYFKTVRPFCILLQPYNVHLLAIIPKQNYYFNVHFSLAETDDGIESKLSFPTDGNSSSTFLI